MTVCATTPATELSAIAVKVLVVIGCDTSHALYLLTTIVGPPKPLHRCVAPHETASNQATKHVRKQQSNEANARQKSERRNDRLKRTFALSRNRQLPRLVRYYARMRNTRTLVVALLPRCLAASLPRCHEPSSVSEVSRRSDPDLCQGIDRSIGGRAFEGTQVAAPAARADTAHQATHRTTTTNNNIFSSTFTTDVASASRCDRRQSIESPTTSNTRERQWRGRLATSRQQ